MGLTLSVLEATNLKHKAESEILAIVRRFVKETGLEVRGVDLELRHEIGRRETEVDTVILDVRFS